MNVFPRASKLVGPDTLQALNSPEDVQEQQAGGWLGYWVGRAVGKVDPVVQVKQELEAAGRKLQLADRHIGRLPDSLPELQNSPVCEVLRMARNLERVAEGDIPVDGLKSALYRELMNVDGQGEVQWSEQERAQILSHLINDVLPGLHWADQQNAGAVREFLTALSPETDSQGRVRKRDGSHTPVMAEAPAKRMDAGQSFDIDAKYNDVVNGLQKLLDLEYEHPSEEHQRQTTDALAEAKARALELLQGNGTPEQKVELATMLREKFLVPAMQGLIYHERLMDLLAWVNELEGIAAEQKKQQPQAARPVHIPRAVEPVRSVIDIDAEWEKLKKGIDEKSVQAFGERFTRYIRNSNFDPERQKRDADLYSQKVMVLIEDVGADIGPFVADKLLPLLEVIAKAPQKAAAPQPKAPVSPMSATASREPSPAASPVAMQQEYNFSRVDLDNLPAPVFDERQREFNNNYQYFAGALKAERVGTCGDNLITLAASLTPYLVPEHMTLDDVAYFFNLNTVNRDGMDAMLRDVNSRTAAVVSYINNEMASVLEPIRKFRQHTIGKMNPQWEQYEVIPAPYPFSVFHAVAHQVNGSAQGVEQAVQMYPHDNGYAPDQNFLRNLAYQMQRPVLCVYPSDRGGVSVSSIYSNGAVCNNFQELEGRDPIRLIYDPMTGHFDGYREKPQVAVQPQQAGQEAVQLKSGASGQLEVQPATEEVAAPDPLQSIRVSIKRQTRAQVLQQLKTEHQLTQEEVWGIEISCIDEEVTHPEFIESVLAFRALCRGTKLSFQNDFGQYYRTGLVQANLEKIQAAQGQVDALRAIEADMRKNIHMLEDQREQNAAASAHPNTGAYMGKLGNGCFLNTALQFIPTLFNEDEIKELEETRFPHKSNNKLARVLVDIWNINKMVQEGKMDPVYMIGYQRRFMDACWECVQTRFEHKTARGAALGNIFLTGPQWEDQADPDEVMKGVLDIVQDKPPANARITEGAKITATYKGHKVEKTKHGTDITQVCVLTTPDTPDSFTVLAESLSDDDVANLGKKQFALQEQGAIRDALLAYRQARVHCKANPNQGDDATNRALLGLKRAVEHLCKAVPPKSNLIINEQGMLLGDTSAFNGMDRVARGARVPLRGKTNQFPLIGKYNAVVHDVPNWGKVLAYKDEVEGLSEAQMKALGMAEGQKIEPSYTVRGIGIVNEQGRLMEPCCRGDRTLENLEGENATKEHIMPAGQLILDNEGRFLVSGVPGIAKGQQVISPEFIRAVEREKTAQIPPNARVNLARGIAEILGHDLNINARVQAMLAPPTMGDCLENYTKPSHNTFSWTPAELRDAGVPAEGCPKGDVRLPGVSRQQMLANPQELEKLTIKFNAMTYVDGVRISKGADLAHAMAHGGHPIQIPMRNPKGDDFIFKGQLQSLICHGGGRNTGHYVNLMIDKDGQVTVQDEINVLPLETYCRATERLYPDNNGRPARTLDEFLACSGFVPQVAHYQRVPD